MRKSDKYNTPYDRDMADIARRKGPAIQPNKIFICILAIPGVAAGFVASPIMGFTMLVVIALTMTREL